MKKFSLIVSCILLGFASLAQNKVVLDTIMVNNNMNVALFFPDDIRQAVTGSDDFVFTYNREKRQTFGLLQGRSGPDSNLLAVTADGQVYCYVLTYRDSITKLNYFIDSSQSIGNEYPDGYLTTQKQKEVALNVRPSSDDDRFCRYLLDQDHRAIRIKRNDGIILKLLNTRYYRDKVYLVLELKNKSQIDFELETLELYRVSSNSKRKSSYQKLSLPVLHKYNFSSEVRKGSKRRIIYVLPKFTLGDNEKFELVLKEKRGSRRIVLNL
ncbi:DUF4138 domain-containing protein [Formosa haliotis]|uniref:DUF4138 domain-containing protein n=1 Tax=Formosa haliotis TaxID=1555194 RepID=UPI000825AAB3|nr:DUF4138 domain-containing protein [Formosa haliotis]